MSSKKIKIIHTISNILDIDDSMLNSDTTPQDFIEWDSLANMNIYVSLCDELNSKLTFEEYSSCLSIGDLIKKLESQ